MGQELSYFETYEATESDLKILEEGIDKLVESQLVEEEILNDIRFVTYDSKYLYIYTRGKHQTTENFSVEEIPSSSKTGFKIFKIPHLVLLEKKKKIIEVLEHGFFAMR